MEKIEVDPINSIYARLIYLTNFCKFHILFLIAYIAEWVLKFK